MNFVTGVVRRDEKSMDIWIDEGLSSAAEYIYLNSHVSNRYEWYNKDPQKTIAQGNNFFVWGNLNNNSVLDDYATVYLFFQWLRLQAGGTAIYKDIMRSPYTDYRAVTEAATKNITWYNNANNWPALLETWLAANYINAATGKYGYLADGELKDIVTHNAPDGTTSLELLPGEGVYSATDSDNGITNDLNSYAGYVALNKKDGNVSDTKTYQDGVLLSYNRNENNTGQKTTVNLASLSDAKSAVSVSLRRNGNLVSDGKIAEGPFRIDARDMLARNGSGDLTVTGTAEIGAFSGLSAVPAKNTLSAGKERD
jgi:hypothetical protein